MVVPRVPDEASPEHLNRITRDDIVATAGDNNVHVGVYVVHFSEDTVVAVVVQRNVEVRKPRRIIGGVDADSTEQVIGTTRATVELINVDTDQVVRYQIVGEGEADLKHGKISYLSPIAKGIIGKREGAEVEIETPNGTMSFEIAKVQYL
jgi:hypothetical protein